MNEVDRGAALLAAAERLGNREMTSLIHKYVRLVVDRDAGPSDKLKEENTKLVARNKELEDAISMLRTQTEDYKIVRENAIRLQRANEGLRSTNVTLSSKNAELVKKHNDLVDLYAAANVRANAAEKALAEATEKLATWAP